MLHIILTILKIIGITLLVLLGIIICLLLIILFVPIRYDIKASKDEKIHVNATVHWILHIITFRFLKEDDTQICLKIFGIKVYPKKASDNTARNNGKAKKEKKSDENIKKIDDIKNSDSEVKSLDRADAEKPVNEDIAVEPDETGDIEHISFLAKIKNSVKNKIDSLKNKIINIFDTIKRILKDVKDRTSYYIEMLKDDANKRAIGRIWQSIKKLLKALLPKKHKIYVKYGKEDPASLADIIGYVAILKSATNINLQFVPVFDEDILEGKARFKGSIQLILVCVLAFKLYKDKDIRKFLNNFTK